jgi:hypothetical protein
MNNRPHLDRKAADALYRNHFGAFVYAAFGVVNPGLGLRPNWHIDCVCHHLQLMVTGRNARRLVLNQPPRPLGPSVTRTAWVSVSMPCNILSRASTENFTSLADISVFLFCSTSSHSVARLLRSWALRPSSKRPVNFQFVSERSMIGPAEQISCGGHVSVFGAREPKARLDGASPSWQMPAEAGSALSLEQPPLHRQQLAGRDRPRWLWLFALRDK